MSNKDNKKEFVFVNHTDWWTKVAVKKGKTVINYELEMAREGVHFGDIIKGRVTNIVKGLQAAFVNIGGHKTGFLYVDDVVRDQKEKRISKILQEGEEIIVQVIREEENGKGPKLSMKISIPGRYLVYLPYERESHISSKIKNNEVREKLFDFIKQVQEEAPGGFIIRTSSQDATLEELKWEADKLVREWDEILHRAVNSSAPKLLKTEGGLLKRILREYVNSNTTAVIIDSKEGLNFLAEELKKWPSAGITLELYNGDQPLFSTEKIDEEMGRIIKKKIKLPSGAFLVVEETEAFTGIDVNTGSYNEEVNFEQTALKINIEAAREIMRVIRLRNISGLILIDFLNMKKESNKKKVLEVIKLESLIDSAKITFKNFSELGVIEMTRRKTGQSLKKLMTKECPHCGGSGSTTSAEYVSSHILSELLWYVKKHSDVDKLKITVHPEVKEFLLSNFFKRIGDIEKNYNVQIIFIDGKFKDVENYKITSVK